MISEAELRRHAVAAGVDTMVQDLDYGLGWFLAGLFTQTAVVKCLVFKGGTCLRKCYFADYRCYRRTADDKWLVEIHEELDAAVKLEAVACEMSLREIYRKASWLS